MSVSIQILHLSMAKNLRCSDAALHPSLHSKNDTDVSHREELEYEILNALDSECVPKEFLGGPERNIAMRVKHEVEELVKTHTGLDASDFNKDEDYKRFTAEAITSKSLAVKKLSLFVELCKTNNKSESTLQDVFDKPIADFEREDVVMELRTGIRGFPWAQVTGKSSSVDFGDWTPGNLTSRQFDTLIAALMANEKLRTATIGASKEPLVFNSGWATAELSWDAKAAVQASVGVTALLLRCFTGLASLSLRSGEISIDLLHFSHLCPLSR